MDIIVSLNVQTMNGSFSAMAKICVAIRIAIAKYMLSKQKETPIHAQDEECCPIHLDILVDKELSKIVVLVLEIKVQMLLVVFAVNVCAHAD